MKFKAKNIGYLLAILVGIAWLLREDAKFSTPQLAAGDACRFPGDEERYVNAAPHEESEDLFVSCGGFL